MMDIECPIHTRKKAEAALALHLERMDVILVHSDPRLEVEKLVGRI
jgi:hypothetical protein